MRGSVTDNLEKSKLGKTGLEVSRLGAGLSEIGDNSAESDVAKAEKVLNSALDSGINFLDTSACYGISEELVGRAVSGRRDEYVLASKCGHATGGYSGEPWTRQTVRDSIDRSLSRMNTEYIDIMQLHSCGIDVLERGDLIEELLEAKKQGKIGFLGYSGDNEAALWAIESGHFDTLQTSFNLADQQARTRLFGPAKANGIGMIIKRPIANAAWGTEKSPSNYANEYFSRTSAMAGMGPVTGAPDDRVLFALGFALAHSEVDTAIVGTHNPRHMQSNISMVNERLPISEEAVEELHRRFDELGDNWPQMT